MAEIGPAKPMVTIPISREAIEAVSVDLYNTPIYPRSPLEQAREEVAEAEADLDEAVERLREARARYEVQIKTPGSDVRPPGGRTLLEMMRDGLASTLHGVHRAM